MAHEIDYRELVYDKGGLLVVQIKKGYYQIRHHSGIALYIRCFRSKNDVMTAFDEVFPMYDWTQPNEHFQDMPEKASAKIRDQVWNALQKYKTVKAPEED